MLTKDSANSVKLGVPPAMTDRYVVRVKDYKFGPNSKDNPMITVNFELVGKPNTTGSVDTEVTRGSKRYKIAGLNCQPSWFTLVPSAINFYIEFWEKANPGVDFPGVDEQNPDLGFLDGLLMEAIVKGEEQVIRKELTDEEKQELLAAGKPAIGEPITDGEGKPITRQNVKITQFLTKYTGDVPADAVGAA